MRNMGRTPCCPKEGLNRGTWTLEEDQILASYVRDHGPGRWSHVPKEAGLKRCGKSCRLRWLNYLRPDLKRGNITPEEEDLIIRLHKLLGNRWSIIAGRLPGRTDNEIKNYWNTTLKKKKVVQQGPQADLAETGTSNHSEEKSDDDQLKHETLVVRTKATRCSRTFFDHHIDGDVKETDQVKEDGDGSYSWPSSNNFEMLNEEFEGDWMARGDELCESWELGSLACFMGLDEKLS